MVVGIAKFYLNYMRSHGFALDDATVNDLRHDRHGEEQAANFFRGFLWTAWEQSKGPHELTQIPSWNRVLYSLPDIYDHLIQVINEENMEGGDNH